MTLPFELILILHTIYVANIFFLVSQQYGCGFNWLQHNMRIRWHFVVVAIQHLLNSCD